MKLSDPVINQIKTWAIVVMAVIIVMIGLWGSYLNLSVIPILEGEKKTLSATIKEKEALLLVQTTAAELNAVNEKEVAQIPIRIERITRELVPIKEEIIKWRDSNETNCSVGLDKLYEFNFVGVWSKAFNAADHESISEIRDRNASTAERTQP